MRRRSPGQSRIRFRSLYPPGIEVGSRAQNTTRQIGSGVCVQRPDSHRVSYVTSEYMSLRSANGTVGTGVQLSNYKTRSRLGLTPNPTYRYGIL